MRPPLADATMETTMQLLRALYGVGRIPRSIAFVGLVTLLPMAAPAAAAQDCKAVAAPSVDWTGCNKAKLIISGSNLDGANLSDVDFSYSDLRGSSLRGAQLEKATLMRSSLDGSNAEKANFSRIEGYRTSFAQTRAAGASFASAELQRADFTGADATNADFQKAELGRAIFAGATLTGAKFGMANLARAQLATAKFDGAIDFTGAFLFLTRIEGMDLSRATGLQQWQVDQACGDKATALPAGLKAGAAWPCAADTVD